MEQETDMNIANILNWLSYSLIPHFDIVTLIALAFICPNK
jgi:hypothetical protein